MSQLHMLADMNEASKVVMNFIGTDRFNEIVSSIDDNVKAGFTTGLSFAVCLIMGECKTYLHFVDSESDSEPDSQTKQLLK